MGKRGPRKQPTAVRLLKGDRSKQGRRPQEPIPPAGELTPPEYIVGKAREKWEEVLPKLVAMRVMTPADLETLGRYCAVWEQWAKCLDQMRRGLDVLVIRDKDGKVKYMQSAPAATMFVKLGQSLLRMEQEFGLTPSARASMEVTNITQESDKAARFRAFIGGA
jgi:P27 family predicted phage terminase small subunit